MKFWLWTLNIILAAQGALATLASQELDQLQAQAIESNPELNNLKAKINEQSELNLAAYSVFLPELSVFGGYGKEYTAADQFEGTLAAVNINWNLFKGFRDWNQVKITQQQKEIARLEYNEEARRIKRLIGETYYEALYIKSLIALQNEKIHFLNLQKQMAKKKISAGLTSQVDATEIELEEVTLSSEIITLQTDLKNASAELKKLLNNPAVDLNLDTTWPQLSHFDFLNSSFQNHPKLQKLRALINTADYQISSQKGLFLPQIDLTSQFGQITPASKNLFSNNESKVTLLFSWNLFSGFDSIHKNRSATYTRSAASQQSQSSFNHLLNELTQIQNHSDQLLKLQALYEQRDNLSKQYYDLTLSEYRRGVKNSADLANATSNLFENRKKILTIKKELIIQKLKHSELTADQEPT